MDEIKLQLGKPFGPSIVKTKIPNQIVKNLNKYIDNIVENEKKSQELDYGSALVGDVTQEFKMEKEIMETSGWSKFLSNCVAKWVEIEMKKKITKFKLRSSWIVRQYQNEYNPVHWHTGHISGAGFLKVPNTLGDHANKNKKESSYRGGTLNLIHGNKQFLSNSVFTIKPEVGDFYFFPNYLMHTVYPFKGTDEERRSISFNADIDEEIYNVYGAN